MSAPHTQVRVYRGTVPLWLVLAAALPLGALFLVSLVLAGAIAITALGLAAVLLPRLWRRPSERSTNGAIELDPSQYHRVDARSDGSVDSDGPDGSTHHLH
jgi:hypothetical protein